MERSDDSNKITCSWEKYVHNKNEMKTKFQLLSVFTALKLKRKLLSEGLKGVLMFTALVAKWDFLMKWPELVEGSLEVISAFFSSVWKYKENLAKHAIIQNVDDSYSLYSKYLVVLYVSLLPCFYDSLQGSSS